MKKTAKAAKPIARSRKVATPAKGPTRKPKAAKPTGKGNNHTKAKELGLDLSAKPIAGSKPVVVTMEIDPSLVNTEEAQLGRPSVLTPDLGSRVCTLYAAGDSLQFIEGLDGMPTERTVYRWLAAPNAGANGALYEAFRLTFARAKTLRSHTRLGKIEAVLTRVAATREQISSGQVEPIHHAAARVVIDGQSALMALENRTDYGKHITVAGDPKAPLVQRKRFDLSEEELLAIAAGRQVDNADE